MGVAVILFLLGLLLIIKGGDWFVDAAGWMAAVSGVPPFLIGATVVSLATTLPELMVSALAAAHGQPDIACGNAVGSVTANTALILSVSILALPVRVPRRQYLAKILLLEATLLVLILFTRQGFLHPIGSFLLAVLFFLFLAENIHSARRAGAAKKAEPPEGTLPKNLALFAAGAAAIVWGAHLLVDNAAVLAAGLGVPQAVVAATVVAIGTSLPELVTTVTAILKGQSSLSAGNILGANIIDNALILPVCSLVAGRPLPVGTQAVLFDLPICLMASLVAFLPMLLLGRFCRWQGVMNLGLYAAYLWLLVR